MSDEGKPKKGRGHPPKEHQYPKGVSGNPWGRPRGSKNKKKSVAGLTPSEQLAHEELWRPVKTSDGEMPGLRAVHRAQIATAAKGGTNAQRNIIEMASKLENKAREGRFALLQFWEKYKRDYEEAKAFADPDGLAKLEPLLLPHPDDIHVDFIAGEVRIEGPATTSAKKHWDAGMEALADMRAMVLDCRRAVLANPHDEELHWVLLSFTDRFMRSNESTPERYRLRRLPPWKAGEGVPWSF